MEIFSNLCVVIVSVWNPNTSSFQVFFFRHKYMKMIFLLPLSNFQILPLKPNSNQNAVGVFVSLPVILHDFLAIFVLYFWGSFFEFICYFLLKVHFKCQLRHLMNRFSPFKLSFRLLCLNLKKTF